MARNPKVELRGHEGQVVHPITDGDCVIFPSGETLSHKLSEQEEVMYAPEVTNSSPMFKVGEGDSSDYSANVLDGAYQEAVLKGQTYVNTIQEPSADVITLPTPFTEYERTQSKTFTEMQDGTFGLNLVGQSYVNCIQEPSEPSYVALGENLEFQEKKVEYTNEGQIKSAILKGQTLVNIVDNSQIGWYESGVSYCRINIGNRYKIGEVYTYYIFNAPEELSRIYLGQSEGMSWLNWTNITDNMRKGNVVVARVTCPSSQDRADTVPHFQYADEQQPTVEEFKKIRFMLVEGDHTNEDIPYFQGMQSVTMTTELENVCSRYNSSVAKNGKTFTVGTADARYLNLSSPDNIGNYNFKQNTKYLIQFKISNLNLDGLNSISLVFSNGTLASGNSLFGDNTIVAIKSNGIYRTVLTTTNVISTSSFVVKGLAIEWETSTSTTRKLTISQIMCIEYQNGMENWDLPYFEDYQVMKPLKVQSVNKNLCPTMTIGGIYDTTGLEFAKTDLLHSDFIKLNSTLTISSNNVFNRIFGYDKNKKFVQLLYTDATGTTNRTIGATSGIEFIRIRANYVDNFNIQIEEASSATPYTPHQSKTTSALEPITLRAIGNVKDTLDLSTGEYVQRIGEIVLDGSDDEGWYTVENVIDDTSILFRIIISNAQEEDSINLLCDKFKSKFCYQKNTGEAIYISFLKELSIRINKDKLSENSVKGFVAYLQQNPIKIQYQLATPITRKISLEYPNLQTYQDITHVQSIAMDGTLIPKIFLPSDISYKAMLKPNTSYNVIVDREVIDSTNQLTVNLGGTTANITANRTVVTTPSTLSNETLTFSGKDNRIAKAMLIEGSTLINGDLPHFDGIGDVKLGRVVENLCLANQEYAGSFSGNATVTEYQDKFICKLNKEGSIVSFYKLTKQLQNGKKYFAYCPWDCSDNTQIFTAAFRMSYNGNTTFGNQNTPVDNKKYIIFTIDEKTQINPYTHFTIGRHGTVPVNTTMTIRRPILCEYVDGMENWDWESIGYFTGTKNVGNEFMRIGNKNLFDKNKGFTTSWQCSYTVANDGSITIKPTVTSGVSYIATETIVLEVGRTYRLTWNATGNTKIQHMWIAGTTNGGVYDIYKPFTIQEGKNRVKLAMYVDNSSLNNSATFKPLLEEASSATSYVAHKHNSLYILPNEQIPLTFEQGAIYYGYGSSFDTATNNSVLFRIRTNLLELEPNETYRISCGNKEYRMGIQMYNNSNNGYSDSGWIYGGNDYYVHTTKDVHKMAIAVKLGDDDANITPSVLHQIRLEKVTDVTLRSVGNVKDELDLTRGVYIQRIDEIVLDGTKNDKINNYAIFGDNNHFITIKLLNKKDGDKLAIYFNEMLSSYNGGSLSTAGSNPLPNKLMITNDKNIRFTFSGGNNLDLNTELEMLKKYPITVQYVLETPIEHKINIPMKNELNQTIAKPNGIFTLPLMYSETNHVDINSQIYPKVQSRDYISYPVIANNSQLHTVFHNKLGTGNLTVNLCGTNVTSVDGTSKCTITTPSTISQYELRLSGARNKVSNVCVFSGDYMNVNVPYVQGMMNAVNPIVKNVGKNLFDGVVKNGESWWNGRVENGVKSYRRSVNLTPVKPNTKYSYKLANGRGVNFMAHGKDGKFLKYIGWFPSDTSKFTTPSDCYYIHWYNEIDDFTDFYIEESSTPSQYEPYKENTFKTSWSIGYNAMIKGKSISSANGTSINNAPNRYRTDFIKIEFAKIYINSNNPHCLFLYDIDKKYLGRFTDSWVTDRVFEFNESNAYYFIVVFKTDDGEDTTTYISSKETRITLRSLPNGVRDELNLQTGEYIQRVGEIVLDGSDDENWSKSNSSYSNNIIRFDIHNSSLAQVLLSNGTAVISDKYNSFGDISQGIEILSHNTKSTFVLGINSSKLYDSSVDALKQYLQQNPITVQYQLKTPIVKQIDINNFPHSYKDGHVIIESNDPSTNVTAQMTYQCVANRTGQIQEHTEQVEKQEHEINELEMLILENIRQQQNR